MKNYSQPKNGQSIQANPAANNAISKSLERSIGAAVAKAAGWEARGNVYLTQGQWRKALDAFGRRVSWLRWADEVRKRGSVWVWVPPHLRRRKNGGQEKPTPEALPRQTPSTEVQPQLTLDLGTPHAGA